MFFFDSFGFHLLWVQKVHLVQQVQSHQQVPVGEKTHLKFSASSANFGFASFLNGNFGHLQMVQAFPGDQDVHADPSCLSHPCLQQLPSHHEVQQVPTTEQRQNCHEYWCFHSLNAEKIFLHSSLLVVLTAPPLAPAIPAGPVGPAGP